MRTVAHNTIFLTGASLIQKALSFIFFTILARTFTATNIGSYSFALASTTVFAIMVDGGLTPVLIRYVAGDARSARALLKRILMYKAVFSVCALTALFIYVRWNDTAWSVRELIAIASAVMIIDSLNLSLYGVLRGLHNLVFESVGMVVAQAISFIGVVIVAVSGAPIQWAIGALGCGSVAHAVIAMYALYRSRVIHSDAISVPSGKVIAQEAVPFALAGIFARGYSYLDVIMLGSLMSLSAAGTYSIANKLTFVFQFIPLSLSAAIYPVFSRETGSEVSSESRMIWLRSMRYLGAISLYVALVLVSLRESILGFFGKEHVEATAVLVILSISLLCAFLSYPVGALLNGRGLQKFQTIAMGMTLGANAIANIILIPYFGAEGAALSALIGNAVLFGSGAWFVSRYVGSMPWREVMLMIIRSGFSAVIAGMLVVFLDQNIPLGEGMIMQLARIVGLALWGALCYSGVCIISGVVTQEEVKGLRNRMKSLYESFTRHT